MSRPPALRVGIVGTGFMARVHARAVRAAGGVVTAVAASSPAKAADAARSMFAGRACASAAELVDRADVDVVDVCTPNHLHAAHAALALQAGKHVVCEKPLAVDVAEAEALCAVADSAGVRTAVPFAYRFYPAVREARARIERGDAGRLWLLHGVYLQDWLSSAGATNWRVDPARGGASRAFADIGVHWCDLMEFVTGHRITELSALTARAHEERDGDAVHTEDGAIVTFRTDLGAGGSLVVSQASPGRKNALRFSFDGVDAGLRFDQERPDRLLVGSAGDDVVVHRDPDRLTPAAADYAVVPAGHPQGYQDCFTAFMSDLAAAVGGGSVDGLPAFADGLRAARITEAVLRSAASGAWEKVA